MDRSQIPQGPDLKRDYSRSGLQVIRCYWVHLWWSPSAGCNQSSGSLYSGVVVPLFRWLCVSGSQHISWLSVWGENMGWECLSFLSFGHFYTFCLALHQWLPLHLCFFLLFNVFFFNHFYRVSGGCWFYSHHHILDTSFLHLFVFCSVLCWFPTLQTPVLQVFCFHGKCNTL